MEGFSLVNLEQTEISAWNFDSLKTELEKALSVYDTTVYTDDTIKLAKNDRTQLNKAKTLIENRRKAFKAQCLEPYNAVEPKIKELVSMIEEHRNSIGGIVTDYEDRQRAEKEAEIRAFYDKKAHELGALSAPLFDKILDKKWLTKSSGKKYQSELQTKINNALSDIREIKAMQSPFVDTLIEKYVETLSVDEARAKHEELVAAASKAGFGQSLEQPVAPATSTEPDIDPEKGMLVKLYGSKHQISQILDFAKAIGVKIEVQ